MKRKTEKLVYPWPYNWLTKSYNFALEVFNDEGKLRPVDIGMLEKVINTLHPNESMALLLTQKEGRTRRDAAAYIDCTEAQVTEYLKKANNSLLRSKTRMAALLACIGKGTISKEDSDRLFSDPPLHSLVSNQKAFGSLNNADIVSIEQLLAIPAEDLLSKYNIPFYSMAKIDEALQKKTCRRFLGGIREIRINTSGAHCSDEKPIAHPVFNTETQFCVKAVCTITRPFPVYSPPSTEGAYTAGSEGRKQGSCPCPHGFNSHPRNHIPVSLSG